MTISHPTLAFDETITALRPSLVAQATFTLGSRVTAEDIVQDALLEISTRRESIDDIERYARRTVHNRALNEIRRRGREHAAIQRSAATRVERTDYVDPLDGALAAAFDELTPAQRACAVLCWAEDLTASEASRIIGCSAPTVRVHLHRARRTLRSTLARQDNTEER